MLSVSDVSKALFKTTNQNGTGDLDQLDMPWPWQPLTGNSTVKSLHKMKVNAQDYI